MSRPFDNPHPDTLSILTPILLPSSEIASPQFLQLPKPLVSSHCKSASTPRNDRPSRIRLRATAPGKPLPSRLVDIEAHPSRSALYSSSKHTQTMLKLHRDRARTMPKPARSSYFSRFFIIHSLNLTHCGAAVHIPTRQMQTAPRTPDPPPLPARSSSALPPASIAGRSPQRRIPLSPASRE